MPNCGGRNKKWKDLNFNQKRHRLIWVLNSRILYFWEICGKERKKYYASLNYTEDNIEDIRKQMFDEYMSCLEKHSVFERWLKIQTITKYLGD